jgi:DNA-binding CsgD family transcriptional regulator
MAVFDDRFHLLAPQSMPMLVRLAGARDPADFCEAAVGLLGIAVPHHTAVVTCNYSVTVFREGRSVDKDASQGSGSVYPLNAHNLMHNMGEPFPGEVLALGPDQLRRAGNHFRRHIEPSGWEYALVLPFRDGSQIHGSVVLYRTPEQGEFLREEVARACALHPVCETVLRRLLDQQAQRVAHDNVVGFLRNLPVGLIMLDWGLQPIFVNAEGYRQTQIWNHAPQKPPRIDPKDDFRLPTDLLLASDAIRSKWFFTLYEGQPMGAGATGKVAHPKRIDFKATITASLLREDCDEPPNFLIRYSGMASRVDRTFQPTREQLAILTQLSPAERTVAMLTIRGLSNQEIAQQLNREISTVKDHLHHIFDKLGIRSRSQLTSLLSR